MLTVLQRMHALGVIHRDVKLENIFIGAHHQP
jgi:serine/threonine protein kinase